MKKLFSAVCCFLVVSLPALCDSYKDDIARLDHTIELSSEFEANLKIKVTTVENMLHSRGVSADQQFKVYGELASLYMDYNFDKAIDALDHQLEVSSQTGNPADRQDVLLSKAYLLTKSGYFLEARNILEDQIDTTSFSESQELVWCDVMQRFCSDYQEYNAELVDKPDTRPAVQYYRSRILALTDPESEKHQLVMLMNLVDSGDYQTADSLSHRILSKADPASHEYAIYSYYQAVVSRATGHQDDCYHWFIESAISDINGAVKDNASLYCLALELLGKGEVERAFHYTQLALADALFYNGKLRPWQIARTLPSIENAYVLDGQQHDKVARRLIIIISVLALLLALLLGYVLISYFREKRNHRKMEQMAGQIESYYASLTEANEKLQKTIAELSESNTVKEEYIGLFLSMCSSYINKLKKYLTMDQMDEELKAFYNTFDTAFLQLYPDFVRNFNALLKPEDRIELKKDELLNTELRIFALIRLGITQSSHIASLLRYSVNTIYNYRAQIKKSAIGDPEKFEEQVKSI